MSRAASTETPPRTQIPAWRIALVVAIGVITGFGLLIGARAAGDIDAATPMTAVGIATLCYLAAAATGLRWMAWALAAIGPVFVVAAELADLPRWAALAAVGLVLLAIGLVRRQAMTVVQAIAMIGYFGVAVVALFLAPAVGLVIAGVALGAHAAWDLVHYRRNIVVDPYLALWCIGLDVFLGTACIVLALSG